MYTIGSLADLISGKNTPNKTKVEIKEVHSKPFKSRSKEATPFVKSAFKKALSKNDKIKEGKSKPFKSESKETTPFVTKFKKPVPKHDAGSKINEMPFKRRTPSEGNENEAKKRKIENEEPVSQNAKNARKRMRDTKKDRLIDPEVDKRTIFIGNLAISTKKKQIIQYFSKYGKVKSIRFRCLARADIRVPKKTAFITKQFHPNATTLNCYVYFEEEQSCKDALQSNGTIFNGNHIRVDLVQRSKDHDQKKAIFVGNLPFDAKDEDLWTIFEDCGKIESVRIVRDRLTMIGKGYAYINFDSADSVELSLQMSDVKVKNRTLRIQRAGKKSRSKKRNTKGEKVRKVLRTKKPKVTSESNEETENDNNKNSEADTNSPKNKNTVKDFEGVKFTDKKNKKKINKGEMKKKKLSKMLMKKN